MRVHGARNLLECREAQRTKQREQHKRKLPFANSELRDMHGLGLPLDDAHNGPGAQFLQA